MWIFPNNDVFLSLKVVLILANSTDPDQIQHDAAFHLGLNCFPKYPFRGFPVYKSIQMVWEINIGVCPRLEFDNIMFIICLGYDFYIYGAFEFLCNSIANL